MNVCVRIFIYFNFKYLIDYHCITFLVQKSIIFIFSFVNFISYFIKINVDNFAHNISYYHLLFSSKRKTLSLAFETFTIYYSYFKTTPALPQVRHDSQNPVITPFSWA